MSKIVSIRGRCSAALQRELDLSMGHQRLGKLPAHRLLPEIVRYLVTGGTPTADLVDQVTEVGRDALKLALKDPVFIEALWLLLRIPQAAASDDFAREMQALGVPVAGSASLGCQRQSKSQPRASVTSARSWSRARWPFFRPSNGLAPRTMAG